MRTIITETIAYKFDELSEAAKQRAIDNCRETEFFAVDEYFATIKKGLELFGLKLTNWQIDFDSVNRSSWSINFDRLEESNLEMKGQRLRTWLINNLWSAFFERKHWGPYAKNEKTDKWRYAYYSKIQYIQSSCPFTGCGTDEDFLDIFRDFLKKPTGLNLQDLIEQAVHNTFKAACDEWEAIQTDEYTLETIEANDYEFDEHGNLI